ncbi:hypothetical protein [Thalassovita gelatinovora]|uniref:hypothetical protein n=1 Tax=Thalassovita gelatinovora TaxID=53501 RepID=UPI00349F04AD
MWSKLAYNQVHLFARATERVGAMETPRIGQQVVDRSLQRRGCFRHRQHIIRSAGGRRHACLPP